MEKIQQLENDLAEYYKVNELFLKYKPIDMMLVRDCGEIAIFYADSQKINAMTIKEFLDNFNNLYDAQLLRYPKKLISKIEVRSKFITSVADIDDVVGDYVVLEDLPVKLLLAVPSSKLLNKHKRGEYYYSCCVWCGYFTTVLTLIFLITCLIFSSFNNKRLFEVFGIATLVNFVAMVISYILGIMVNFMWGNFAEANRLQEKCENDLYRIQDMVLDIAYSRLVIKAFEQSRQVIECLDELPLEIANEIIKCAIGDVKCAMTNYFSKAQRQLLYNYVDNKQYTTVTVYDEPSYSRDSIDTNAQLLHG